MIRGRLPLRTAAISSGGKDGVMACYMAMRAGYHVKFFVNLVIDDRICYHFIRSKYARLQAKAMGLKIIQKRIVDQRKNKPLFEKELFQIFADLKKQGIEAISVAYISPQDYQNQILTRICRELGLRLFNPYLGRKSKNVLRDIIKLKIKPLITIIDPHKLDKRWLGRVIDRDFYTYISEKPGIDCLGDMGEYHTFVVDAPFFIKKVNIIKSSTNQGCTGDFYLQIEQCSLVDKEKNV